MGFAGLEIKREYRSLLANVVDDFYMPVLSEAVLYKRAVGFFSSSALISLTEGIRGLIVNGGHIELIASPRLSDEDLEAIRDGYSKIDERIKECLIRELKEATGKFEEARLNLLSNLIASGALVLKIALLDSSSGIGIFHEKLGLVYDGDGNCIAFTGSMNETANAFFQNYESIDVYTSWGSDAERVTDKESAFSAMWEDYEPGLKVVEFPEVSQAIVEKYKVREGVDPSDLDVIRTGESRVTLDDSEESNGTPRIPKGVIIRPYQVEAIDQWERSGFKGIFDMATGTGKTYTALAAISKLSEKVSDNLAVIIVCPYQHLVEQWKEDIIAFGMRPIVCYSASTQKNWRDRLKNAISGFRIGAVDRFCVITTNATFSISYMQEQIKRLKGNCLIVADEAHNFGASKLFNTLPIQFPFRLALSATINRHGDIEGTEKLFSYFGEKCIEYTLEDAINHHMLTPYYYYPVVVTLNEEELEQYLALTKQIGRLVASCKKAAIEFPESAKMLLIKRARIVAGARNKIEALRKVIEPYRTKNHILVYCGATTIQDAGYVEGAPDAEDIRQIDKVSEMLGHDLGMHVSQFTSKENSEKRETLKEEFADGKQIQALIAIRCLDEGVNIPSIETAFIMASSTNPKEYVQRRGRVLRLSDGKAYARIYDFITLPFLLDCVGEYSEDIVQSAKSLAVREIARMRDFAQIAENPIDTLKLIGEAIEIFNITPEDEEGEVYV